MFVLKRVEDGKYVARPGSEHSYTKRLEKARVFEDRASAEADACGNERVYSVREVLTGASDDDS